MQEEENKEFLLFVNNIFEKIKKELLLSDNIKIYVYLGLDSSNSHLFLHKMINPTREDKIENLFQMTRSGLIVNFVKSKLVITDNHKVIFYNVLKSGNILICDCIRKNTKIYYNKLEYVEL